MSTPLAAFPAATATEIVDRLAKLAETVEPAGLLETVDRLHLLLDRVDAELAAPFNGWSVDRGHASQVFSTAVFYMGAAVQHSDDPARTLSALHTALGMTTTEG